jgi:hypothetical protein
MEEYHCFGLHTKCYPPLFCKSYLHKYTNLLEIIIVDFVVINQPQININLIQFVFRMA